MLNRFFLEYKLGNYINVVYSDLIVLFIFMCSCSVVSLKVFLVIFLKIGIYDCCLEFFLNILNMKDIDYVYVCIYLYLGKGMEREGGDCVVSIGRIFMDLFFIFRKK